MMEDGGFIDCIEFADDAIATVPLANAAGSAAHGELAEAHGVALLDDLGIGDGGVGHVRVQGMSAVVAISSAGATGDGFVVAEACAAEEEIVHRALAAGLEAEGFDEGIDEALANFDIATDDGGIA